MPFLSLNEDYLFKFKKMFKKIYTLLVGGLLLSTAATAQQFVLDHDTVALCDEIGSDPHPEEYELGDAWDNFEVANHLTNITETPIVYTWNVLPEETHIPEGWTLYGFCDNFLCRSPFENWVIGFEQTSSELLPGTEGIDRTFKALICAPSDASDGQAIVRVRVQVTQVDGVEVTDGQVDTATYTFTKPCGWTGVNTITIDDQRVSLYPNPANTILNVAATASLHASKLVIYDIIGRQQSSQVIDKNANATQIDISALAPGIYMMRLQDEQGAILTTRKFIKK